MMYIPVCSQGVHPSAQSNSRTFSSPQKEISYPSVVTLHPCLPLAPVNPCLLFASLELSIWRHHVHAALSHVCFWIHHSASVSVFILRQRVERFMPFHCPVPWCRHATCCLSTCLTVSWWTLGCFQYLLHLDPGSSLVALRLSLFTSLMAWVWGLSQPPL